MMKSAVVIAGIFMNASAEVPTQASLVVVPLGSVKQSRVQAVAKRLSDTFHVRVLIARPTPLPKSAYYAPRSRYRADKLLVWLSNRYPEGYVMGVTSSDISTGKGSTADWGVFGLGQMPGRAAVVSDFRLGRKGSVSTTERLGRIAIHELGHNLGLPHCKNLCRMSDAKGSIKSVDSTVEFCRDCRAYLTRKRILR